MNDLLKENYNIKLEKKDDFFINIKTPEGKKDYIKQNVEYKKI